MQITISKLTTTQNSTFYPLFVSILRSEFPGYTTITLDYLLEKVYTEQNFYYWLQEDLKTILVASIDDTFVGFAVIDSLYGGVSLLRWLGVSKEHQRKGIGKRIIIEWEKIALTQGAHKMEVASQPEAREFYAKAGLNLEGKRIKSYFGIDQYIFGKVIA